MYILKYQSEDRIGFLKSEDGWAYYPRSGPIDPSGSTLFTKGEMLSNRDLLGPHESFVWYGSFTPWRELK